MAVIIAGAFCLIVLILSAGSLVVYKIATRKTPELSEYDEHMSKYIKTGDEEEKLLALESLRDKEDV